MDKNESGLNSFLPLATPETIFGQVLLKFRATWTSTKQSPRGDPCASFSIRLSHLERLREF